MRWQTAPLTLVVLGLVTLAVQAQAPRRAPDPRTLWAQQTGHMTPVASSELWGDMYCSGGTMCMHQNCCCFPVLSYLKSRVVGALNCLLPCGGCGTCDGCAEKGCGIIQQPSCCRPLIPSVRFHDPCCAPHGTMELEGPMLMSPPVPEVEPETLPPSNAASTGSVHYYRQPTRTTPARPASSRLVTPGQRTSSTSQPASTAKRVNYEQPVRNNQRTNIPVNPLRR